MVTIHESRGEGEMNDEIQIKIKIDFLELEDPLEAMYDWFLQQPL